MIMEFFTKHKINFHRQMISSIENNVLAVQYFNKMKSLKSCVKLSWGWTWWVDWLESWLMRNFKGLMMYVSTDRQC